MSLKSVLYSVPELMFDSYCANVELYCTSHNYVRKFEKVYLQQKLVLNKHLNSNCGTQ